MGALDRQVGGDHYKNFVIQPVEFVTKNELGFLQGAIIKRICRYNIPGGKGLQDLQKVKHEIDLLIQLEEWDEEIDEEIDEKIDLGTVDILEGLKAEAL